MMLVCAIVCKFMLFLCYSRGIWCYFGAILMLLYAISVLFCAILMPFHLISVVFCAMLYYFSAIWCYSCDTEGPLRIHLTIYRLRRIIAATSFLGGHTPSLLSNVRAKNATQIIPPHSSVPRGSEQRSKSTAAFKKATTAKQISRSGNLLNVIYG